MSTSSRRTKWYPAPPPPPSPKILHFPLSRRTRRKPPKPTTTQNRHHNNPLLLMHQKYLSYKGKLENLFDQENHESPTNANLKTSNVQRRERVEEREDEEEEEYCRDECINGGGGFEEEEKWRFQAEILRAECNFLRMEREFALKKLEKNRVKMERTLRSAVQTLVSGRNKIFPGKNVNAVLEEEIEDLAEKLEELQKSSRIKETEARKCSNFDKKAGILQRRLEKLGGISDESCANVLPELVEPSLSINTSRDIDKASNKTKHKPTDVDMLRTKMEGLSKGVMDRVEDEYNSIVCSTANSSVASSASTSKRIQCPELSSCYNRQAYQEAALINDSKCSGRCKAIIRRIVEQVRAETEQWSQMQEMLGHVRGEMEQLQASRDYWENQAHKSDCEIQSLRQALEEWKAKALSYENKAIELQLQLSQLKQDIENSKADLALGRQREKEKLGLSSRFEEGKERTPNKDLPPLSLGKQLAKEKRMFRCRLKENRRDNEKCSREVASVDGGRQRAYSNSVEKRSPLRDIGNSSPLATQNSRRLAFRLLSPESSRIRDSFRK